MERIRYPRVLSHLKRQATKVDLEEAIKWAMTPDNQYRLAYEWRRLNERD